MTRRPANPYPPTAQHAIREGKIIAKNIAASIQGGPKKAFRYKPLGSLASLGRRSAVAEILGVRFSGFFAWWLWRTIYLMKLPSFDRKVRVAIDWTLDLASFRATSCCSRLSYARPLVGSLWIRLQPSRITHSTKSLRDLP